MLALTTAVGVGAIIGARVTRAGFSKGVSGKSADSSAGPRFVGLWEAKGIRTGMVAYTRLTFRGDGTGQEYVDIMVPGAERGTSSPTTDQFTWHTDGNHMVIVGASGSNTAWSVTDDGAFLTLPNAPVVTYSRVADSAPLPAVL